MQIETIGLTSETCFSTEAHLSILRLPLYSWHWNEFRNGLGSWFWVSIGPTPKMRQRLNEQFKDCLKKMWLFTNDSKHRYIIYRWKSFFTMSIDSRSLPQNKALFGSNLLAKFCHLAWKNVQTIWTLSSRTEDTIMMRRPRGIDWHPNWPPKLAREWKGMVGSHDETARASHCATFSIRPPGSWPL